MEIVSHTRKIKMEGQNNPRWNGGKFHYKDHYQMKLNRKEKLREVKEKCEVCGKKATEIHHKDKTKCNHNISNLLAVCNPCHKKIHKGRRNKSKYTAKYGIRLKDISIKTKIKYATLSHLMRGKLEPTDEQKKRIAKALNMPVQDIEFN